MKRAAFDGRGGGAYLGNADVEDVVTVVAGRPDLLQELAGAPSELRRWLAERYPDARPLEGGGLEVEFPVLEPHWLVRHILQYGADAEVIEPPAVRALMKRVLGAG